MRNNKWRLFTLCLVMVAGMMLLSGCEDQDNPVLPEEQDYAVTLYFPNGAYISSGDESLEKLLTYETTVKSTPEKVYIDVLEALKQQPEGEYDSSVTDEIVIQSVTLEGVTASVSLGKEGLNGGALTEVFLISQIVDTLVNNFEEVEQVQFLVEGEKVDTLMGHFDAEVPFSANLLGN